MAFSHVTATLNQNLCSVENIDIFQLLQTIQDKTGIKPVYRKGKYILDSSYEHFKQCENIIEEFISAEAYSSDNEKSGSDQDVTTDLHESSINSAPVQTVMDSETIKNFSYMHHKSEVGLNEAIAFPASTSNVEQSSSDIGSTHVASVNAQTPISKTKQNLEGLQFQNLDEAAVLGTHNSSLDERSDSMPPLEDVDKEEIQVLRQRQQSSEQYFTEHYDPNKDDFIAGEENRYDFGKIYMTESDESTTQENDFTASTLSPPSRTNQHWLNTWTTDKDTIKENDFSVSPHLGLPLSRTGHQLRVDSDDPGQDYKEQSVGVDISTTRGQDVDHDICDVIDVKAKHFDRASTSYADELYLEADIWDYIRAVFERDVTEIERRFGAVCQDHTQGENLEFHHVVIRANSKDSLSKAVDDLRLLYDNISQNCYKNNYSIPRTIDEDDAEVALARIENKYKNLLIKVNPIDDCLMFIGETEMTRKAVADLKALLHIKPKSKSTRNNSKNTKERYGHQGARPKRDGRLTTPVDKSHVFMPLLEDGLNLVKEESPQDRYSQRGSTSTVEPTLWAPHIGFSKPSPIERKLSDPFAADVSLVDEHVGGITSAASEREDASDLLDESSFKSENATAAVDELSFRMQSAIDHNDSVLKKTQRTSIVSPKHVAKHSPADTTQVQESTAFDQPPEMRPAERTDLTPRPLRHTLTQHDSTENEELTVHTANDQHDEVTTPKHTTSPTLEATEHILSATNDIQTHTLEPEDHETDDDLKLAINLSLRENDDINATQIGIIAEDDDQMRNDTALEQALQLSLREYETDQLASHVELQNQFLRNKSEDNTHDVAEDTSEDDSQDTHQLSIFAQPYTVSSSGSTKKTRYITKHTRNIYDFDSDEEYAQSLKQSFQERKRTSRESHQQHGDTQRVAAQADNTEHDISFEPSFEFYSCTDASPDAPVTTETSIPIDSDENDVEISAMAATQQNVAEIQTESTHVQPSERRSVSPMVLDDVETSTHLPAVNERSESDHTDMLPHHAEAQDSTVSTEAHRSSLVHRHTTGTPKREQSASDVILTNSIKVPTVGETSDVIATKTEKVTSHRKETTIIESDIDILATGASNLPMYAGIQGNHDQLDTTSNINNGVTASGPYSMPYNAKQEKQDNHCDSKTESLPEEPFIFYEEHIKQLPAMKNQSYDIKFLYKLLDNDADDSSETERMIDRILSETTKSDPLLGFESMMSVLNGDIKEEVKVRQTSSGKTRPPTQFENLGLQANTSHDTHDIRTDVVHLIQDVSSSEDLYSSPPCSPDVQPNSYTKIVGIVTATTTVSHNSVNSPPTNGLPSTDMIEEATEKIPSSHTKEQSNGSVTSTGATSDDRVQTSEERPDSEAIAIGVLLNPSVGTANHAQSQSNNGMASSYSNKQNRDNIHTQENISPVKHVFHGDGNDTLEGDANEKFNVDTNTKVKTKLDQFVAHNEQIIKSEDLVDAPPSTVEMVKARPENKPSIAVCTDVNISNVVRGYSSDVNANGTGCISDQLKGSSMLFPSRRRNVQDDVYDDVQSSKSMKLLHQDETVTTLELTSETRSLLEAAPKSHTPAHELSNDAKMTGSMPGIFGCLKEEQPKSHDDEVQSASNYKPKSEAMSLPAVITIPPLPTTVYQPDDGIMNTLVDTKYKLPGYQSGGTIMYTFDFKSGRFKNDGPYPREQYQGTYFKTYLPINEEGNVIGGLLKEAFEKRRLFTVAKSSDIYKKNIVVPSVPLITDRRKFPNPIYLEVIKRSLWKLSNKDETCAE